MRSVVIALLVFVAFSRSDFLLPFSFSDDLIKYTAKLEQPTNNDTICPLAQLNYCQYSFNSNFGLNSSISYYNGSDIFMTIQNYLSMNVTELNKVCKLTTLIHLMVSHPILLPINSILSAFDYVRTFRGLEWICGGGFRETIGQFNCFEAFPTTVAYQNCMNNFNQTVSTTNFCPAVQQTGDCLNHAYRNMCGDAASGHYGCENFSFTFDKACPGLKCAMGN
uniref:Secreted protein n=1 Tax=Caenorhabditis tropicalis TaxID=1561998 RepID=A0A1I7U647_9PELO